MARPWIVAGMHRSGTSLMAGWLARLGIDMGASIAPDWRNPRGYFENPDILDLHRRLCWAATSDEAGQRDWGWTVSERLDRSVTARFDDDARRATASRASAHWGFKDPRASLWLEFWAERLPEARFLLTYRAPWDVADSMQRLAAPIYLDHPDYAYRIWAYYNRHVLDFHRRHRARTLLVSSDAALDDVEAFAELVAARWELPYDPDRLRGAIDPELFRKTPLGDPLVRWIEATDPGIVALKRQLDAHADLASPLPTPIHTLARPAVVSAGECSIVVTCVDDGAFLRECIASLERAGAAGCQWIIVVSASQRKTAARTLESLDASGAEIVSLESDCRDSALAVGIERACGRFVVPLAARHRLSPSFLETALERITGARDGTPFVYADRREFGMVNRCAEVPEFTLDAFLWNDFPTDATLFPKTAWRELGGFDLGLAPVSGWDFRIRAALAGWRFERVATLGHEARQIPVSPAVERRQAQAVRRLVAKHEAHFRGSFGARLRLPVAWPSASGAGRNARRPLTRHYWNAVERWLRPGTRRRDAYDRICARLLGTRVPSDSEWAVIRALHADLPDAPTAAER